MGFLKDLNSLNRMGRQIQRDTDVSARLADAQAAMASANATMTALAARATSTAALTGTSSSATVVAARRTGQFVNFAPVVELDLLVLAGAVPAPVTLTEIVDPLHLARVQPGAVLPVRVGSVPSDVFVDWSRPS